MLTRRRFLGTLSASLLVAPLAAEAQPAERVYRIGLFHVGLDHVPPSLNGLRDGLKALGYEEGRNLKLDFRNVADEAAARAVALELVRQRPDLIVLGNISPDQKGCATFGADLIYSLLPAALVDVRHYYPCPARSESSSAGPANSRGRPGNDGHSVLKDHSGR